MTESDELKAMLENLAKEGGIGLIPTQNGFKIAIGINKDDPELIFHKLNDFEGVLLSIAAKTKFSNELSIQQIKKHSDMVDTIRKIAIKHCEAEKIDVSKFESIPIEIRNKSK